MNDAKEALYDVGATGNVHPGFHGSWAFVGYTGPEQVKWAKTISQPRYKGPAVIEEMIPSPSAEADISKILYLPEYGVEVEISKVFSRLVLLRSAIETGRSTAEIM